MKVEDLARWESLARKAFFGYRNECGWGVPASVTFEMRPCEDRGILDMRWTFFDRQKNEYRYSLELTYQSIKYGREIVEFTARTLATQCLMSFLPVYLRDRGFLVEAAKAAA